MTMMKSAFNLSTGADTGGAAIREVEAFHIAGKASGWSVHSMVCGYNYIHYPEDIRFNMGVLHNLYDAADVMHLNHTLHGYKWYDHGQGKPVVLEHHGLHKGSFDVDFEASIADAKELGAIQIGSTANLELFGPITWVPIAYSLDWLQAIRASQQPQPLDGELRPIIIAHAPTNRAIKSTQVFLSACSSLKARGFNIEMLLIERLPHLECLRLKARADILVDQLQLGYGCNAIEAWGMGIPVVGGISDPAWRAHMVRRWGRMPMAEASEETLEAVLARLIKSPAMRKDYTALGQAQFDQWHTPQAHVASMSGIYEEALTHPSKPNLDLLNRFTGFNHDQRLRLLQENRKLQAARERGDQ
jgi:hypothetical protein